MNVKPAKPWIKERYRDTLDVISKARYDQKISIIGDKDPYELAKSEWSVNNVQDLPGITYPDIVDYFVNKQSAYTLDDFKAYKSLEPYDYFVCRWVKHIRVVKFDNLRLISATVRHPQCMKDTPLHPWLIAENNGKVMVAHCNCMAGLGESCSHVGAVMFAVDASVKLRESPTVMQDKPYWLLPSAVQKVSGKTIQEIDFTSDKTKKRKPDKCITSCSHTPNAKQSVPYVAEPTSDELKAFFSALHASGSKPVLLSLVPEYSKHYVPRVLDKRYPLVLSELQDDNFVHVEKETLLKQCGEVMKNLTICHEEVKNVEELTREQAKSPEWHRFRTGRITASHMKNVCTTSMDNPSQSLIKTICYPDVYRFATKVTKWECQHEIDALESYVEQMQKDHENFSVRDSGFVISEKYPFMGASPDAIASCDCCGEVCVEIKCPYCKRDSATVDSLDSNFCLERHGDLLKLKKSHQYYYQIQCQLFVCEKEYSDFIVWTNVDYHAERIELDSELCKEIVEKSTRFFSNAILPELVGKLYSRPLPTSQLALNSSISTPEAETAPESMPTGH